MSTARVDDSGDISPPHLHAIPKTDHLPKDRISLKAAIEGLLFVQNQAMSFERLSELLGIPLPSCQELVATAKADFDADESRGLQLVINEQGVQLATKAAISPFIQRLDGQKLTNLSLPALETLSVIAFKGPITKAEIEAVRGVNCDGVVQTLLEKKLIFVSGEKPVLGRPRLYAVTQDFLYYFGLRSLKDLPVPSVEMPDAESLKEMRQQLGSGKDEAEAVAAHDSTAATDAPPSENAVPAPSEPVITGVVEIETHERGFESETTEAADGTPDPASRSEGTIQ
ncbi:MAG: SMC-Scp complex subunit ScpB [Candidatus Riflebacteria bacterium]|nr:SMC-Scp complex subunit ScpB [Candidatus Riflebacteria bacterium]